MTQMLAEICYDPDTGRGDPLKLQAAVKLTFYQIRHILCAPRDKEGKLVIESQDDEANRSTPEEVFTWSWVRRCLPRWLIAKKWRERQELETVNGNHE